MLIFDKLAASSSTLGNVGMGVSKGLKSGISI